MRFVDLAGRERIFRIHLGEEEKDLLFYEGSMKVRNVNKDGRPGSMLYDFPFPDIKSCFAVNDFIQFSVVLNGRDVKLPFRTQVSWLIKETFMAILAIYMSKNSLYEQQKTGKLQQKMLPHLNPTQVTPLAVSQYIDGMLRQIYENQINTLNISWLDVPGPAMDALIQALKCNMSITSVSFVGVINNPSFNNLISMLTYSEIIESIDFNYCHLNDSHVPYLVELVSKNKFLKRLNLGYNFISDQGFMEFRYAMMYNDSIVEFNSQVPSPHESYEPIWLNRAWSVLK